ncbi:hypothetical protein [Henriciella pelagia]|jgi:hypothetical protein|uniref:hypothetical protein n=1 Tax=Henriciella pelagia TaxID=1977912 RepID=UPI001301CDF2|nr:hypothetical protein [Henriciella pelagia]
MQQEDLSGLMKTEGQPGTHPENKQAARLMPLTASAIGRRSPVFQKKSKQF